MSGGRGARRWPARRIAVALASRAGHRGARCAAMASIPTPRWRRRCSPPRLTRRPSSAWPTRPIRGERAEIDKLTRPGARRRGPARRRWWRCKDRRRLSSWRPGGPGLLGGDLGVLAARWSTSPRPRTGAAALARVQRRRRGRRALDPRQVARRRTPLRHEAEDIASAAEGWPDRRAGAGGVRLQQGRHRLGDRKSLEECGRKLDPSQNWDWVERTRLYEDAGLLSPTRRARPARRRRRRLPIATRGVAETRARGCAARARRT